MGREEVASTAAPVEVQAQFEAHREELRVHCYRMTGSTIDADDLVQETYLRAWKARGKFRGEASLRTWLYRIATNACIDFIRARPTRTVPELISGAWDPQLPVPAESEENLWIEPFPSEPAQASPDTPETAYLRKEAISIAFITALQVLTPRQRAILILRDVLDWHAEEVAGLMGVSVASVKSALHRARTAVADARSLPPSTVLAGEARELLQKYAHAWETADVEALVALLKEDAVLTMPPYPSWYRGREAVAALFRRYPFGSRRLGGWRSLPTFANGKPAFSLYRAEEVGKEYKAFGIEVLTLENEGRAKISRMDVFKSPRLVRCFGFPLAIV